MKAGSVLNELCQKWRHIKTNMAAMRTKTYAWRGSTSLQPVVESEPNILVPFRQWNDSFIIMYVCDEDCLTTWNSTTGENQILSFDLQTLSWSWARTWHTLKEIIGVGALCLRPICAEYGLETRLSATERTLVLLHDLHPTCAENVH